MLSRQNCSWFTTKWTSHPAWSVNPGDERVVHGQSAAGSEHEDLGEQEEEQGGGHQQHGWTTSGEGGVADTLVSVWAFWRKVGRRNISNFKGSTYINQADPGDFCGNCCNGSFFANFAKDTIYSLQSDENNPKTKPNSVFYLYYDRTMLLFSWPMQWEIKIDLLWEKCFNIPHYWSRSLSTNAGRQHIEELFKSKTIVGMVWSN